MPEGKFLGAPATPAVESDRAGEAGRGFAAVSDLVSARTIRAEEEAGGARDQLAAT